VTSPAGPGGTPAGTGHWSFHDRAVELTEGKQSGKASPGRTGSIRPE
jgi:hypothetical protein